MFASTVDPLTPLIVARWASVEQLWEFGARETRPWVLVEHVEAGRVAVGPLFSPSAPICVGCFLARRLGSLEPDVRCAPPLTDLRSAVQMALPRLIARRAEDAALQLELRTAGEVREHLVLPIPGCLRCATHKLSQHLQLDDLTGPRVGIVSSVVGLESEAPFVTLWARGANTAPFLQPAAIATGMAADHDPSLARVRAVAECTERYCAAFVSRPLRCCARADLDARSVVPARWVQRVAQLGKAAVTWVEATSLVDDEPVWVPAAAVFIPFEARCAGDRILMPLCSTGLAAGRTFADACRSALQEIEERDTFMRAWRGAARPFALKGVTPIMANMTLARVPGPSARPTVAAFLEGDRVPYCVTGVACRDSVEQAAKAAQLEAIAGRAMYREMAREPLPVPPRPPRRLSDHGLLHALCSELRSERELWLHPAGRHPAVTLEPLDPRTCAVDLTTPDVATTGLKVVRVLAPGRYSLDHDSTLSALPGSGPPHPL